MTEKYDVTNTPYGPSIAADDVLQVSAGNSGSVSTTIAGNKKRNWVSQQVALRPSPTTVQCANNNVDTGNYDAWGRTSSNQKTGMSFSPSVNCVVTAAAVSAAADVAASTGDPYIDLWTDNAGQPGYSIATGSTMNITSTNPFTPSWATSTFSGADQVTLSAGATYWLVDAASSTAAGLWFYQKEGSSGTIFAWDGSVWANTTVGNPTRQFVFNISGNAL